MKIACVQMDVLPGKPEENYAIAQAQIRKAARNRPDVILLPETWITMTARQAQSLTVSSAASLPLFGLIASFN